MTLGNSLNFPGSWFLQLEYGNNIVATQKMLQDLSELMLSVQNSRWHTTSTGYILIIITMNSVTTPALVSPGLTEVVCSKGPRDKTCVQPTRQFPSPHPCLRLLSKDIWGLTECFLVRMVYNPSNLNSILHNQDHIAAAFCVLL